MTSRSLRSVMRPVTRPVMRLALASAGLVLVLGLAGCGGDDEPATGSAPTATATEGSTAPSAQSAVGPTLDLTVSGDTIDPTNQQVDAKTGDTLEITITSDRAGELHVHSSPEQELEFGKGTTRLEVQLEQPGQVDIEEHASDTLVARVLVK